jgi:hypothetical protein
MKSEKSCEINTAMLKEIENVERRERERSERYKKREGKR